MALHAELNAWLMPPEAREEWLRLTALLDFLADSEVPCRRDDPAAWWPERKGTDDATVGAIAACRSCRARAACLDYALAADERFGVWAGTLPEERRSMRLRMAKTSATNLITAASGASA